MHIRLGTRSSKLALWQTNYVIDRLRKVYPEHSFEVVEIKTKGDKIQNVSLRKIGDKGLFVKEIEEQLLNGSIQMAVHSMKDMPSALPAGLCFADVWGREDARDVIITRKGMTLDELGDAPCIGTGSMRRSVQIKSIYPNCTIKDIRGNVDTRIRKLDEGQYDAIIMAAAGLHRMGLQDRISGYLDVDKMIPASAQGVLAIEVREDNKELLDMLNALGDPETAQCVEAERLFLAAMDGNCHVPVGAYCERVSDYYVFHALYGKDMDKVVRYSGVHPDAKKAAEDAIRYIRKEMGDMGMVYLVGGGPGDPGLFTLKGLDLLRRADCIIYDRLVNPSLLKEANTDCELIYVGKQNKHHTMKQEDINALLVKKAQEYSCVVRLKGGDVYVFGRGGEEGIYLREHGVRFEVVPGISSALAGLAYAGIPITHRGIATGFHVVSAHNRHDELSDIDFDAMARSEDTCVFLMGLTMLDRIVERLMKAGKDPQCPIAIIAHATLPNQKTLVSTLDRIVYDLQQTPMSSPALIVVGDVVKLRKELNFFEERPLFTQKILVPRVGKTPSRLAKELSMRGAMVQEIQVSTCVEHPDVLDNCDYTNYDIIVLSSRNAVTFFLNSLRRNRVDMRSLHALKFAVVGEATKRELESYGLYADYCPQYYTGRELCELLVREVEDTTRILIPKASGDNRNWQPLMNKAKVEILDVYDTVKEDHAWQDIDVNAYDAIVFTCSSSVTYTLEDIQLPNAMQVYSIGQKTSETLRKLGINEVIQAQQASYDGLLECITRKDANEHV